MSTRARKKQANEKLGIIIFTGIDGSGKTTIKKQVEKDSSWKHICIDRFSDSIIYDKVYRPKNPDRSQLFYDLEKKLMKIANVLIVYCRCHYECIRARRILRGEVVSPIEKDIKRYDDESLLYWRYLMSTPVPVLIVDTDRWTVKECSQQITDCMSELYE